MEKYPEYVDLLRPLECPICQMTHPLRKHGAYSRNVCDLLLVPVMIPILRYYCSGCGKTVSFLPSFCLPRKQYCASAVSLCLQLILACGASLKKFHEAYPAVSRVLAGVWLRQWSFSAASVITVLRNHFNFKPRPADVCAGHNSGYIAPESLEAFFISCDFALGSEIVDCHGRCGVSGNVKCDKRTCVGVLKVLQEKFSVLPFHVRLF